MALTLNFLFLQNNKEYKDNTESGASPCGIYFHALWFLGRLCHVFPRLLRLSTHIQCHHQLVAVDQEFESIIYWKTNSARLEESSFALRSKSKSPTIQHTNFFNLPVLRPLTFQVYFSPLFHNQNMANLARFGDAQEKHSSLV